MKLLEKIRYRKYMSEKVRDFESVDYQKIDEFLKLDYRNFSCLSEHLKKDVTSIISAIRYAGSRSFIFYVRLPAYIKEYYKDNLVVIGELFKRDFYKSSYEWYYEDIKFIDFLKCFSNEALLNDEIWPLIMVQDRYLEFFKNYPEVQSKPDCIKMVLESEWAPTIVNNFKKGERAGSSLCGLFNFNYLTDETIKFIGEEIEKHIMPNILDKIKDENGIYDKDLLDTIQAEFKSQFKQLKAEKQKLDYKKSDKYIEDVNQSVANFKLDDDDDNEQLSIKLSK